MFKPRKNEAGDTLVEVILTIVIIGAVASALFAASATGSTASNRTRDLTTVDAVLRNAAEATKNAVRVDCLDGGTYSVNYTAPPGFSWSSTPNVSTPQSCPPLAGSTTVQAPVITLTGAAPNGAAKQLIVVVRSP